MFMLHSEYKVILGHTSFYLKNKNGTNKEKVRRKNISKDHQSLLMKCVSETLRTVMDLSWATESRTRIFKGMIL